MRAIVRILTALTRSTSLVSDCQIGIASPELNLDMAASMNISELGRIIQANTQMIENHTLGHMVPWTSCDQASSPWVTLPEAFSHEKEKILDAVDRISTLVLGPLPYLLRLTSPMVLNTLNERSQTLIFRLGQYFY